jgi:hypothetical protein
MLMIDIAVLANFIWAAAIAFVFAALYSISAFFLS